MSYELKKPYTDTQKADFIVEYNHNGNLTIEETDLYLFALEANEIMGEKEIEIDVPEFETVTEEVQIGEDEYGNPIYETVEKQVPIMIEVEETITVIDYDDDGNPVGEHEETITKQVQKTHKETITIPYPVINPNYEEEQKTKRQTAFYKDFIKIGDYGNYRKKPKGYSSAVESMNSAFNVVSILGKLPADTLIFYPTPDFSDAEQCTEEWLVENATKIGELTAQEFGQLYKAFLTAWNTQEHL